MNEETPAQATLDIGKKPPLSLLDQLLLSNFWFALNFQSSALLPVVVAAQVLLFASNQDKVVLFGILSTGGTVAALLAQPLIGALSDHTPLRGRALDGAGRRPSRLRLGPLARPYFPYGRRRPYILLGTILSLIGMALLAKTESLLVFALAFLLVQIASNGSTAAYQSLIPDRVPPEQRGSAAGYMGLMTIFGSFASLAAAAYLFSDVAPGPNQAAEIQDDASAFYLLTGVILLVTTIVTVIGIVEHRSGEGPLPRADSSAPPARRLSWRQRVIDLWIAPLRHYNFRWVFLTRLSLMMGLWLFQTFIEYYLDDVLHLDNFIEATGVLAGLALIGAVVSAVAAGWLSDKTGRVKIVYLASGLMALAASAFVVAPSAWLLWPMAVLFGLGYGAYLSVDWALAVDALPSLQEAGKDMGLWSIASNLPTVAAPVVGSVVITLVSTLLDDAALGYRLVFALAALTLIAAAVFIIKVREERPTRAQTAHSEDQ
jgi:MFS family permease